MMQQACPPFQLPQVPPQAPPSIGPLLLLLPPHRELDLAPHQLRYSVADDLSPLPPNPVIRGVQPLTQLLGSAF